MLKFIKNITLFGALPCAALIACLLVYGTSIPNLSNSISFNAKMLFLKNKKVDSTVEVLAVGSSMTLNNLNSAIITKLVNPSYINTASWGQSISDDYELIKIFNKVYKPKSIIISSNFMDFQNEWCKIKFNLIHPYLTNNYTKVGFDLRYNIKNAKKLKEYKNNKSAYTYLKYDPFGGVNLSTKHLVIDTLLWNGQEINKIPLAPLQYANLDSIANFCKINSIRLIFVQSPFRKGYYTKLNQVQKTYLNNHIKKIKTIIHRHEQQFIDTSHKDWPDDLFADYSHLNEKGSEVFTSYFLAQLHKAKRE